MPANPNLTICGWNLFCQGNKYLCFIPTSSFQNLYEMLDLDLTFVAPNNLKYFEWKCTHDHFLTRNLIFAPSSSYKNVTRMKLHYIIFAMG